MIVLVTGPPGAGKSYYAVRKLAQALDEGKVVATNVELREDWADVIDKHNKVRWLRPRRRRAWNDLAPRSFVQSHTLSELFNLRIRGTGESRGVMLLDEAHNWMNARSWSAKDREDIVRFFTQHRKLGWDVYLIAQDAEMIDKQVRTLFEYHVSLRNLRKAKVMGFIPLTPFNTFLAIWRWHSSANVITKRELYTLTWRKTLYDTMATSHGLASGADGQAPHLTWLPLDQPSASGEGVSPGPGADLFDGDQEQDVELAA